MDDDSSISNTAEGAGDSDRKPVRADARRNVDDLLTAALSVFSKSGVDAPVREIAKAAGVGVGTLYRHFPQRSDLIKAVFRREIDACAEAAATLSQDNPPFEALRKWMNRYVDFIAAKRGLAAALHSGDPAYEALPAYFEKKLRPALQNLLDRAAEAGEVKPDLQPNELLRAVASLSTSAPDVGSDFTGNMMTLMLDGMRRTATDK